MSRIIALRPWWLVLLVALPAVALAWRRWPPPLPTGRRRVALGLHLLVITLVVGALADVQVRRPPAHRALVAVVDLSDSVLSATGRPGGPDARGGTETIEPLDSAATVRELAAAKGPDDLLGVVTFGRDAQVELAPTREPRFVGFQTRPDPSFSDLAGALRLAASLLPDGYAHQVLLLSDGRQNLGDAPAAVAELRRRSVRVDVVRAGGTAAADSLVAGLDAPGTLRAGEAVAVTARLRASAPAAGRLVLEMDGTEVAARDVELPTGSSEQAFDLPPLTPGTHRLRARLAASPDRSTQNNTAEAVVRVLGRPEVLVLEGGRGAGRNVAAALTAAGMGVQTRSAGQTPAEVAELARFDAVVLADTPAPAFPPGALDALSSAVRDLGRGLVAVGGHRSFGPGDWKGTVLDDLVPVSMDPPQPRELPSVAVVVVLESMESPAFDSAVLGTVASLLDRLRPIDEFGVVNMSSPTRAPDRDASSFLVPLGPVADRASVQAAIAKATLGDPPAYSGSLARAYDALRASRAAVKHAVIIGDGDALGDVGLPHASDPDVIGALPDYRLQLASARAAGITTSAIGVAVHPPMVYMEHMRLIGEGGGGRFHLVESRLDVPAVLLDEARSTLRPLFEQKPFFPRVTSAGDILAGVPLDAFPQLGGYVVTTTEAGADVALSSPGGDPVLVTGQAGLGRTVAWTSDAEGRWTSELLASPVGAALFGRMVAWSLPTGIDAGLRIDTAPAGAGLEVSVTGPAEGGDLRLQVLGPDQRLAEARLRSVAPGRWQGQVAATDVGTYVLAASVARGGEVVARTEATVAVPYSPEYLDLPGGEGLLGELARRGGALLVRASDAWSSPRLPATVARPLSWLLLAVAAVLWPLDIAVRRLAISPVALAVAVLQKADLEARMRRQLTVRQQARARRGRAVALTGEPESPGTEPERRDERAVASEALAPSGARKTPGPDGGKPVPDLAARLRDARRSRQEGNSDDRS